VTRAARTTNELMNAETPVQPALETLLERYQQGDTTAVEPLVSVCGPMFHRFYRNLGCAPDEAEDVVQEAWLRIHQARHTYRPGAPALPWLFAIARHARVDSYRRRARFSRREVLMEQLPETPAPSRDHSAGADVERLLSALPESQREVLIMLKGEGMTLEEVAAATSSTVGAVKQKAHRAYARLRDLLRGAS